ncbi:unnamed protein product [Prorocentrum cordatum]|uniref:Beta-galactosidase n=1 Tax=Prorocentrum cordatum TaxID=2364126 RepID=A0ABN9QYD4_9DINO|nr:unnamed protein product [Polarella glacialis]
MAASLTAPHTDLDHKHSPYEINFWIPLTLAEGSATLWAETEPGRGDYHPFCAGYGQAVRFYGNQCLHFTRDNDTSTSRVSFDFRVVRLGDFAQSGIPDVGDESDAFWRLFSFYDVMGPDGLVGPAAWAEVAAEARRARTCLGGAADRCPPGVPHAAAAAAPARSRSPEHERRCLAAWGSERLAKQNCARCGWIAHRAKLRRALVYDDGGGKVLPWVAENPDRSRSHFDSAIRIGFEDSNSGFMPRLGLADVDSDGFRSACRSLPTRCASMADPIP